MRITSWFFSYLFYQVIVFTINNNNSFYIEFQLSARLEGKLQTKLTSIISITHAQYENISQMGTDLRK